MSSLTIPNSNPQSLTVIIVNWERPRDTLECIQSVLNQDILNLQILVVDNGSRDNSVALISEQYPSLTYLQLPENIGFTGGYNAGIQVAIETGARWVFLLNNDTWLFPGCIRALLDSGWDVAVPKITYHSEPDRIWCAGASWRAFPPAVIMRGYRRLDSPVYNQPCELQYATGCALLISHEVLANLGGFNSLFENYMEDYDFCWRVKQARFRIGFVPAAKLSHKVSLSLGQASPTRWKYLGRNSVFFYGNRHHFSPWVLWCHLAWVTLRETQKGNINSIRPYIEGIQLGLKSHPNPDDI
jgi:GT2 family glycosyltransferase